MSDRRKSMRDSLTGVTAELTAARMDRAPWLKRRLGLLGSAALPMILVVGVAGVAGVQSLPRSAAAAGPHTGWAVRVCPDGDCARPASVLSPPQFATSRVMLSGRPQAATHKTQVTLTLQNATNGAMASAAARRNVVVRAHQAINIPLATLPSLFAETHMTPRGAATYTITVLAQGAVLGQTTVTVAG